MANTYAPSEKISIYPSSLRSTDSSHYGDNFPSEHNIGKLGNQLVNRSIDGYIITTDADSENNGWMGEPFEFNIGGYNVKIDNVKDTTENIINSTDDSDSEDLRENFVTLTVENNIVYANIVIYQLNIDNTENTDQSSNEDAYKFLYGVDYISKDIDEKLKSLYPSDKYTSKTISLPILCVKGEEGSWEITDIYRDSYLKLIKLESIEIDEGITASNGEFVVDKNKETEKTVMSVDGGIISTGNISTNSNLKVDKNISAANDTINITDNKIVIGKDNGITIIEDNTLVLENTDTASKVEIDSKGKITTTGMIHAEGDIETNGNLSVTGSANFENNSVKIDTNKITVGTSSTTVIYDGTITADESITTGSGNFNVDSNGKVTVGTTDESTTIEKNSITTNTLQVNTSIDVGNSTVTRLTSTKMKSGTVKGTTAIIGGTVSGTKFTASDGVEVTSGGITVSNGDITANNIIAEKDLTINGDTSCKSSISCVNVTANGNITAEEGITSNGNIEIVSHETITTDENGAEKTETIGGNLTVDEALSVGKGKAKYNFTVDTNGNITAPILNGNATSADKVNTKLTITLNNTDPVQYDGSSAESIGFYAPTTYGDSGKILQSNGDSKAPTWETFISADNQVNTSNADTAQVITYAWNYTGDRTTDLTTNTSVYYTDIGTFRILRVRYIGGMIYSGQGHGFGVYVGNMFKSGGIYSATATVLNGNSFHDSNNSIGMSFGCFIGSNDTSTSSNGKTNTSFAKEMNSDSRFTSDGDWVEFTDPVDRTTSSGGFNGLYITVMGIAKS